MTAKELKRIFQKGECLSLDTMRLYNDGKLNKKSMHEVEKHLLECGLCAGAVDGLNQRRLNEVNKLTEHIQRRLAVYMNTPPRVPFFRRFGIAIITGSILLVGSCSWWLFSHGKKAGNATISNPITTNNNLALSQSPISNSAEPVSFQSQNNSQTVSGNEQNVIDNKNNPPSSPMQNLPADLPGKQNTLTVGQPNQNLGDNNASNPENNDPVVGTSSRTANASQPLRVKNVLVYPPVTLDKSTRKESQGGQLTRSQNSDASFQLDQMPTYPGGDEALRNFIMANFKPTVADRAKLTRYATGVMFVVNAKTGAISSTNISFSISPEIDAELLRVINAMPNWNPGKKRGEVQVMLGITFE